MFEIHNHQLNEKAENKKCIFNHFRPPLLKPLPVWD